jgi:methyl-accepting chemotaxis protein
LFKEDRIGNHLIDLKNSIEETREEEKRRKAEDERLNWATGGSAMFAEIIREHSDNLEELAYAIISELVNYIDANQGGIFIINEDEQNEKYIELLSSFAYDRKKMLEKKIPFGAGLVGRCILEKETIYMTNVPKDYLNITSGLGTKQQAHYYWCRSSSMKMFLELLN